MEGSSTGCARQSPLDGVLLSLHGAMVADTFADADGELLRRVRDAIGAGVPVVATLDLHANVTEQMVRWPDALVAYNTYPHVDQVECGRKAGDILRRIAREGLRPAMALARRPLLPHILAQATHRSPMAEVMATARALEEDPHRPERERDARVPVHGRTRCGAGRRRCRGRHDRPSPTAAIAGQLDLGTARGVRRHDTGGPEDAVREAVVGHRGTHRARRRRRQRGSRHAG